MATEVRTMEHLVNAILAIIHPNLHHTGLAANAALVQKMPSNKPYCWTSAYSDMDVIVNQIMPPHQDAGGALSYYDLLLSLGKGHHAALHITDLGAQFAYHPGTLAFLAGKTLEHSVPAWEGGESCCGSLHERPTP
jgi:hypothetical protein